MADTDFPNPFGGGGNEANNPSGSSFLQMQQMFSMMSSMFGFGNQRLNIWGPVGMNESQARMAPKLAALRSTLSSNLVGSSFDGIFGKGEFAKIGTIAKTTLGVVGGLALNDPEVGRVLSIGLGYNPTRVMDLINAQKTMFLRGRERMGTGTLAQQEERINRLDDTMTASLFKTTEIANSDEGRKAMGNVFSGRADNALELALRLQRGGVSGIFGEGYKGGINTDKYNKWVAAGASVGNALVTKDVGQIYSAIQQTGELDPAKTKETFDKIAKMAQYLDVSSENMTKAVLEVQKTVKNQTGSHITTGRAYDIVSSGLIQGQLAGLTPERQMGLVGFKMQLETRALNSVGGKAALALLDPNLMGFDKLSEADKAKFLKGGHADQVALFQKYGGNMALLEHQGYINALQEQTRMDPEGRGKLLQQALASGLEAETTSIPRMRTAQFGVDTASNFYSNNRRYLDVNTSRLTELKKMAANGEIAGVNNKLFGKLVDQFVGEGASSEEAIQKAMTMVGLTGTAKQNVDTEVNSRVASSAASEIEKTGGFDSLVTHLKSMGGLELTDKDEKNLRLKYASGNKSDVISALRARSTGYSNKNDGLDADREKAFNQQAAIAETKARSAANQARVTERSDAFIKKYGDGDASKAMGVYMGLKTLRDAAAGIDVNEENEGLDEKTTANIKDALIVTGMTEKEASDLLFSGNKNTIKAALEGRLKSFTSDIKGFEGASAVGTLEDYVFEQAMQQNVKKQLKDGTSSEGVATNDIPKDLPDLIADFVKELPKLSKGIGAFVEEIKVIWLDLVKSGVIKPTKEGGDTNRGVGGAGQPGVKVEIHDNRAVKVSTTASVTDESTVKKDEN